MQAHSLLHTHNAIYMQTCTLLHTYKAINIQLLDICVSMTILFNKNRFHTCIIYAYTIRYGTGNYRGKLRIDFCSFYIKNYPKKGKNTTTLDILIQDNPIKPPNNLGEPQGFGWGELSRRPPIAYRPKHKNNLNRGSLPPAPLLGGGLAPTPPFSLISPF